MPDKGSTDAALSPKLATFLERLAGRADSPGAAMTETVSATSAFAAVLSGVVAPASTNTAPTEVILQSLPPMEQDRPLPVPGEVSSTPKQPPVASSGVTRRDTTAGRSAGVKPHIPDSAYTPDEAHAEAPTSIGLLGILAPTSPPPIPHKQTDALAPPGIGPASADKAAKTTRSETDKLGGRDLFHSASTKTDLGILLADNNETLDVPPQRSTPIADVTAPSFVSAEVLPMTIEARSMMSTQVAERLSADNSAGNSTGAVISPSGQVERVIIHLSGAGSTRSISLQLTPKELGRVEITVEQPATGAAHVTLTAERPETLRQLQTEHAALSQALDRAGLAAAGCVVSYHLAASAPHVSQHADPVPNQNNVLPLDLPSGQLMMNDQSRQGSPGGNGYGSRNPGPKLTSTFAISDDIAPILSASGVSSTDVTRRYTGLNITA